MADHERPKTDYANFTEQMKIEEEHLRRIIKECGATIINLPDSKTIQSDEIEENARILFNALHNAMGKPEISKEQFSNLVTKLRKDLGSG